MAIREQVRRMDLGSEFPIDEGCFVTELSNIPEDADAWHCGTPIPWLATSLSR